jgi:hypothetical protein
MAIAKAFEPNDYSRDFEYNVKDIAIGGKLVTVTYNASEFESAKFHSEQAWQEFVKDTMAAQLVEFMLKEKLIEFTKMKDNVNQTMRFNARCYLSKDDQVRLLRTHY